MSLHVCSMLVLSIGREVLQALSWWRWKFKVLLHIQLLFLLWLVIEDHDNLFIMAEVVHFLGIGVLIYKLWTKKNAGGEALDDQEEGLSLSLAACSGS